VAKAAIIGCGMIAGLYEDYSEARTYSHAKAYAQNPAFDETALYDIDSGRAEALAEKAGGVVMGGLDDILSRFRPDVVSVCTPDDRHVADLEILLRHENAPKVIFCEKPVCQTPEELERIEALERAGGTRVIVNHSRRFDPAHRNLKAHVETGVLGALVQGHVDYYGGWRHLGVHIVDILQYLLRTPLDIAEAGFRCESKYADDPTLNVLVHAGDAPIRFSGFPEPFYQLVDIVLLFEKGQIKITDFGQRIDVWTKTVNAEHENVLIHDAAASGPAMTGPITNAIEIITDFLATNDETELLPYGLAEAKQTMETLWNGSRLYAAQSS